MSEFPKPTPEPDAAPAPVAPLRLLDKPLAHIGAWAQYFLHAEIPIMAATAAGLEELRARDDDVDANEITALIQSDPLMTLKLLAHVSGFRRPAHMGVPETISECLVLMGIAPFFRAFGPQRTVEDWLAHDVAALRGVQALLHRAERAGQFALSFAIHRGDTDAAIIHEAAFLHDFAEILLWLHAPTLMLRIQAAQQADSTLRSTVIQKQVLNVQVSDLQQALMKLWQMPELLVRITDDRHAEHPSVRSVLLAVRLARHTALGWDNPAVPDDVRDIAQFFNAPEHVVLSFLHNVDHPVVEAANVSGLPQDPVDAPAESDADPGATPAAADASPTSPSVNPMDDAMQDTLPLPPRG
ncbi:MAG: hypothetical protein OHK0048_20370 [Rhodoferax sp.]